MTQFPLSNKPLSTGSVFPITYSWMEPKPEITSMVTPQSILGVSAWAQDARSILHAHASHDRPLILIGEPGTGKRFLARQLHHLSHRSHQPFIAIECQTLSPASLRAALLGLSTMGASTTGQGLLELARGGTLYLGGLVAWPAELSDLLARIDSSSTLLPPFPRPAASFQPHLVTSHPQAHFDVRLVFGLLPVGEADARETCIAQADRLVIPPLRERKADIEMLAEHFLSEFLQTLGREDRSLGPDARRRLLEYEWPGNIKELKSAMLYAVHHLRTKPVSLPDLPPPLGQGEPQENNSSLSELAQQNLSLQDAVEAFEKQLITEALRRTGGHQTRAAQILGIKLTTLNMKLARFGIDPRTMRFQ